MERKREIVESVLEAENEKKNKRLREVAPLTYTVPELARVLGIATVKAYDLVHVKGFPSLRIGKKILVPRAALEKWLEDACKAQQEGEGM